MSNTISGGYMVKNLELHDAKYKCLICPGLLRDPVQLSCGHRICQSCVPQQNKIYHCVLCKEDTDLNEVQYDKGFRRDMQKLDVSCISCEWNGHLKDYQDHLEKLHHQYTCSHCGDIFNSITLMDEHEEKLCKNKPVDCVLQRYGCIEKILRSDLDKHYLTEKHQESLLFCINQLYPKFIERYRKSPLISTHMRMETSDLTSPATPTSSSTTDIDEHNSELEHFFKIIDIISSGSRSLNDEMTRLTHELSQQSQSLEATDKVLSTMKTSVEESQNVLGAMNTNLLILQQELSSLKLKYEEQQVTSFDGILVWKITQFQEKMTDAKSERQTSIYSPPFRSSPTGYLMRARLYLNGDGNARRTHMSLFFVLMCGSNDSILQFPFSYKVTFCLYDQTSARKLVIDSFRPDIKSNSFQRPRSDMNIASGIPKFVPLAIFEQTDNPYVKDDTMYIKVMVDFENLSKTVLPYALSLNAGLPTHVQHRMIRKEVERITLQSQAVTQVTPVNKDGKVTTKKK